MCLGGQQVNPTVLLAEPLAKRQRIIPCHADHRMVVLLLKVEFVPCHIALASQTPIRHPEGQLATLSVGDVTSGLDKRAELPTCHRMGGHQKVSAKSDRMQRRLPRVM